MSKVKVIERSFIEKEIDLEYPIYLCHQYDLFSEYRMVKEDSQLSVVYDTVEAYIKKNIFPAALTEDEIKRHLITEQEFREALNHLITDFSTHL